MLRYGSFLCLPVLKPFTLNLIVNDCILTPHRFPQSPCPWKEDKHKIILSQWTPRSVRGGGHGPWCLHFPRGLLFSSNFSTTQQFQFHYYAWLNFQEFYYKRGASQPQSTHPSIPFSSISTPPSSQECRLDQRKSKLKVKIVRIPDRVCNDGSSAHRLSSSSPSSSLFSLDFYAFKLLLIFMLIF